MAGAWSAMDPLGALSWGESSDDESGDLGSVEDGCPATQDTDSTTEGVVTEKSKQSSKGSSVSANAKEVRKKGAPVEMRKSGLDYEALSRHGYTGGPSIMHVPAPINEVGEQDWSWSGGKRKGREDEGEESLDERERTREATTDAAEVAAMKTIAAYNFSKKQRRDAIAEQKAITFSQKEKRKREMGQASRGKNYVEEEKRLLRDQGVYSGFDT